MPREEKKDGPTMYCFSELLNVASAEEERVKVGGPVQAVRVPSATGRSGFQGLSWG